MVFKLQEDLQVVVWGMVLEQVVFLLEQVEVEVDSLEVVKEEEEMERQQGPGQVDVEPGNLHWKFKEYVPTLSGFFGIG